jgi:hypothetical protein
VTVPLGRMQCERCAGVGRAASDPWLTCGECDGIGHHWLPGGPRFAALHELADASVGDIVELATGHRARVVVQSPKKNPISTYVHLIDDFTDEESSYSEICDATLGVVSIAPRNGVITSAKKVDDHDGHGEKDADAVDPLAARVRAGDEGPLL